MRLHAILLIFTVTFLLFSGIAHAKEITVEKKIVETELKAGGSATVELHFTNPYGVDVPAQIVDKNVLGNNGIDVSCMEFTVPANAESTLQYNAIQLFSEGKTTLPKAVVNYTDPESGKPVSVKSNELDVKVEKGATTSGGQGITTIYQCNGMNMQSTSYSSSTSNNQAAQQEEQENKQTNEQLQQMQKQMQDQMQQKKNAVQNNQMAQDAGALKQEMQRQREEYKQMQQELANRLTQDQQLNQEHQKLAEQGYNMTNFEVDPESNSTGNFKMQYTRPDGETATLSGKMQNGTMEELQKQDSLAEKQMMQALSNNTQFQQYAKELAEQGFNKTDVKFDNIGNATQAVVQYQNPNGDTAEITADFVNQTVQKVDLQKEEKKDYKRIGFFAVIVLLLIIAAYLVYRKYNPKKKPAEGTGAEDEKPIDYRKEAKKMLESARQLFSDGKEKDAYEMAGRAIRFYYTHKLGYKKELTNTQTIKHLRENKIPHTDVQKCLNMCGMVEFARYKANRKDFDEIMAKGHEIVR
jgi:hypothetical protein